MSLKTGGYITSPSTYADINFQNKSYYYYIIYGENTSL